MPATCTREKAPDRHQDLPPRFCESGADESRLLAPGCATHLPGCSCSQWRYESTFSARYSGGAAPAFNRFPWLPSAIDCLAKLSTSQRLRKRQHHRTSDHEREGDQVTRIDRVRRWRWRKVDHGNRVLRHVRREKTPEIPIVDGDGINLAQMRSGHTARLLLDHDLVDAGFFLERKLEWKGLRGE